MRSILPGVERPDPFADSDEYQVYFAKFLAELSRRQQAREQRRIAPRASSQEEQGRADPPAVSRAEALRKEFDALPFEEQVRKATEFRKDMEANRIKPAKIYHVLGVVDGVHALRAEDAENFAQREARLLDRIVTCESRLGLVEDQLRQSKA